MTDISNKRTFTDPLRAAGSITFSTAKLKSIGTIKTTKIVPTLPTTFKVPFLS